jgi:propanol-preferring alcohol dehydrogenase
MLALQLVAGSHEPELREVPEPEPGPGEVLLRVAGAGACHSDVHLLEMDTSALPWPMPFTLGHENAGWVAALGDGVRGVEVGEPVAVYGPRGCGRCPRCIGGLENYCERPADAGASPPGIGADGGMAPLMVVSHPRYLVPLGDLDPVEAAPLTDAGLTPYAAVKRSLGVLGPGSTAVVLGVGGLGHLAVQLLRALTPATVVAVDRSERALGVAAAVGAHRTVLAGDGDTAAEIRALTRGLGADAVLDLVGADDTLHLGAAVTRTLGHFTIVGIAGGTVPVGFFNLPNGLSVASSNWGSLPELGEVLALARTGDVRARIERFALADAAQAYDRMRAHTLEGRAVVVPHDP